LSKHHRSVSIPGLIAGIVLLSSPVIANADERISYKTAQGDTINAVYIAAPVDAPKPSPAVVLLHGCGGLFTKSGKVKSRETAWSKILHNEGWAVLLPDSFGSRGYGSLCQTKVRPVKPELQRPFDAMGALTYLAGIPEIDAKRIALLGWSNGAMTGLHTVRDGAEAATPAGNVDFKTAVVFYPGCIALNKSFPDYRPRVPTLIQHGELDDWTLAKPCRNLVEKVNARGDSPPMAIDVYPGAYHDFDHPSSKLKTIVTKHSGYASGQREVHVGSNPDAREKAIVRTMDWLRAHLAAGQ